MGGGVSVRGGLGACVCVGRQAGEIIKIEEQGRPGKRAMQGRRA